MSDRLLREYLRLAVEAVRTKRVPGQRVERFDLGLFRAQGTIEDMLGYAEESLEKLGEGSGRVAYLLSQRYVLKIAKNEAGIAQNRAEAAVARNPKTQPVIAGVNESDAKGRWLVSELVRPLRDEAEFEQLTGLSWTDFRVSVRFGIDKHEVDSQADPFIKAVVSTARSNRLLSGDIIGVYEDGKYHTAIDHWGKTAGGRVVLLDYGFDDAVEKAHY